MATAADAGLTLTLSAPTVVTGIGWVVAASCLHAAMPVAQANATINPLARR
jgi:hypothetical protein